MGSSWRRRPSVGTSSQPKRCARRRTTGVNTRDDDSETTKRVRYVFMAYAGLLSLTLAGGDGLASETLPWNLSAQTLAQTLDVGRHRVRPVKAAREERACLLAHRGGPR